MANKTVREKIGNNLESKSLSRTHERCRRKIPHLLFLELYVLLFKT